MGRRLEGEAAGFQLCALATGVRTNATDMARLPFSSEVLMADMMSLKKWVSVPLKDTPESTDAREAVRDVSKRCSLSVVSTPGMGATAGAPGGVGARGAGTGGRRRCSCRPN